MYHFCWNVLRSETNILNKFFKSKLDTLLLDITKNNTGIEIGGPSISIGKLIYENTKTIDNVIFSEKTIWSKNEDYKYRYHKNKT